MNKNGVVRKMLGEFISRQGGTIEISKLKRKISFYKAMMT